jgi:hypothetical protein
MPRFAVLAATAALAGPLAAAWAPGVQATDAPPPLLSWPGKSGAPEAQAPDAASPGAIALPHQFFASSSDDLAAPPPPPPPRSVPGSQTVTNTSSINTASNRARQNEILTADSAADGPVAGAQNPN